MSEPSAGTITELVPRARRGAPPRQRTLVSGLTNPQGMAFDRLRGREVLYVAESDELDRYVWLGRRVGARRVVIGNPPDGGHAMKNVVVGSDHTVYVAIGSSSNASPEPPTGGFPRASVLAYTPSTARAGVFATGIRNGDGLSFAPDGTLWTAVNQRDDIAYPFHRPYGGTADAYGHVMPAYVDNHPPDEVARLTAGRNLRWPFCNPDPDVHPGRRARRRITGTCASTPTSRRTRAERSFTAPSCPASTVECRRTARRLAFTS